MKKTILILSVLAFIASGCGNKKEKVPFDLTTFPSEWRSLTKENGKLMVCEDPFQMLRIDGNKFVHIYYARGEQSDFEYEILNSYQTGDTIVIELKGDNEGNIISKFIWMDKEKGLIEWLSNDEIFVVNDRFSEYLTKSPDDVGKSHPVKQFDFNSNICYDYEGTLGEAAIQLSICVPENAEFCDGSYCYKKYENKIKLSGVFNGDQIELTEFINDKPNGFFKGKAFTDDTDRFEGIWTDASGKKQLEFKLTLMSSVSNNPPDYRRYSDFSANDDDVENFMKKVKSSIANSDKEWLANHIRYPLNTTLNGTEKITVKDKQQLIGNFEQIFYPAYKEEIKKHCVCNMFTNSQGIMLGRGEIWMGMNNEIIAINNDF